MQFHGDLLADRKRLKSNLILWRTLALLTIFGGVAFLTARAQGPSTPVTGDYIAQINIEGMITDDPKRDKLFQSVRDNSRAKALIVRMDSPGGTTVGGEQLYLNLRQVAARKPVVSIMRTTCASACYMAAVGADNIVAREGTLTGSIGVLLQSVEFSRLADKLGITPITIKSGRFKDAPSFTEPFSDEARDVVKELVTDAYNHFVKLIAARRPLDENRVRELSDGRVYTGRQAAELKLIDGIGGEREALDWLAKTHKINPKLEVREIKPEREFESMLHVLSRATGIEFLERSTVGLDGLVSIWHPSLAQ